MSLENGEMEGRGVWCELGDRLGPALPCRDTLRIFIDIRAAVSQDSRQRITQPATSSETAPLAVV